MRDVPSMLPAEGIISYFNDIAQWKQPSGQDFLLCDPAAPLRADRYNRALCDYLIPGCKDFSTGGEYGEDGAITHRLSESVGFRLQWSLPLRGLRLGPEQWQKPALLPDINPDHYLFWYCLENAGRGEGLEVTMSDGEIRIFCLDRYESQKAVLAYRYPHQLLPIRARGGNPYHCLYGQLREVA
jgi:hypothetical protein